MSKQQWILCPVCGNKTRTMIQEDTEKRNFSLLGKYAQISEHQDNRPL